MPEENLLGYAELSAVSYQFSEEESSFVLGRSSFANSILRRTEGAGRRMVFSESRKLMAESKTVRTSLPRSVPHDGEAGLSPAARSTLSSKKLSLVVRRWPKPT